MRKTFIISLLTCLLLVISSQAIYSQTNNSPQYQTFEEWCINRENLTPETRHTVEVLLEVAETKECNIAQSILEQKKELVLSDRTITDVSPLANLINLERLYLDSNQITDISPLANLMNLESLYLDSNQITDISPLANLINLELLILYENQITDISPLAN
ncbi:MAG: leucine-rich repeat domain-containing protein, partial [Microcoleaceae cyanobacterium]